MFYSVLVLCFISIPIMASQHSTGYGPSASSKHSRLLFDGNEEHYEQWEVKFLAYMRLQKLKDVILTDDGESVDESKNEEAYAELVQFLDDKSLSLVMRDAADDGRAALKILREHYAGSSTPRIISLYTELTSLVKKNEESITDYVIRAETAAAALRNAGESVSDSLLIAMILKGLPDSFQSFVAVITQSDKKQNITEFKIALRSFEETERARVQPGDSLLKMAQKASSQRGNGSRSTVGNDPKQVLCYDCGGRGHIARHCRQKKSLWCKYCKKSSHTDKTCRFQNRHADKANVADAPETESVGHSFAFKVDAVKKAEFRADLLVDCGATTHILNDESKFSSFDKAFIPEKHSIELANGERVSVAVKRGNAGMKLKDSDGNTVDVMLKNALFVPTFPQNIFSVQAATDEGASVSFQSDKAELVTRDGTVSFPIVRRGKLYYLNTQSADSMDSVNYNQDLKGWHEILGHCNQEDVLKLEHAVDGMKIVGKKRNECEVCVKGKMTNHVGKNPRERATSPLKLVHTDLAGPIMPASTEGFKYAISFTDDFSGAMFVYFLKNKSETVKATEKFLADSAPFGKVRSIRSDNGSEFISGEFETLLRKNQIKHETSAPYSPHQNGTAERQWRTIFEMGRCMLLEKGLPKELWPYAVHTAVYIRNRCFNSRTKLTPVEALTGRRPNISNMRVFGCECHVYSQRKQKLDERCKRGIFVGYDGRSPAYLVYFPDNGKVIRCRVVHFVSKKTTDCVEQETQTDSLDDEFLVKRPLVEQVPEERSECKPQNQALPDGQNERYPKRDRKPPSYLSDYETKVDDKIMMNVDFCYKFSGFPQTYKEAIESSESDHWKEAMNDEIESLKENGTYTLTALPEGRQVVGGKWVYTVKESANGSKSYKARYVAKGYSQREGLDYHETFAPTANLTSLRVLMQLAAQHDIILHQMDVKTAYLNAPIDCEIYMEQPEGFEVKAENEQNLVCRLKKSLYGLKQSGRNWNQMLHKFLKQNGFVESTVESCLYTKQNEKDIVVILVWVDDFIVGANNNKLLCETKQLFSDRFKMKDMGRLSYFLGIDFEQGHGYVKMNQKRYIEKLLEKYGMSDCKPRSTPCEQKLEWGESEPTDPRTYREIVGSLIYLMVCTRPDISWVITRLSQFLSKPLQCHMVSVKHVLRYLKGTAHYELCYRKNERGLSLIGYSDSDWASSTEDRRSTSGYCFSLTEEGPPISWKSRKQPIVALSTCEAEYIALTAAVQELMYLCQLLKAIEIGQPNCLPVIFEDNQGTIALANNPVNRQRSKHIDVRYHFVRSQLDEGKFLLEYCPTGKMIADLMTKPAAKFQLVRFRSFLFGK